MRKIYILLISIIMVAVLFTFTGCGNEKNNTTKNSSKKTTNTSTTTNQKNNKTDQKQINYKEAAEKQMATPNEGETIAIMKVKDFGEMKFKFFSDIAPKAVENFTTHAKNGYYNGLTFHRIMDEFMIQGGDPDGNGTGGESIWGEGFETELDQSLVPYKGSLCMAMSQLPNSIGSQFFITQANYSEQMSSYLKSGGYPQGLIEQYKTYGGYLSLYMHYTVFGQIFEGMDVLDKIAKVETQMSSSGEKSKPVEDVIIESIEVTTFTK